MERPENVAQGRGRQGSGYDLTQRERPIRIVIFQNIEIGTQQTQVTQRSKVVFSG